MTRTVLLTKRFALVWLALGLLAGLVLATTFGGNTARADGHVTGLETVTTQFGELLFVPGTSRSETETWIYGSGFVPGTGLFILLADSNGVLSDITIPGGRRVDGGGTVFPLVANENGAWATNWRVGRFTRNGVGGESMVSLWVTDAAFNFLASAPLALCDLTRDPPAEGEDSNVPEHCTS